MMRARRSGWLSLLFALGALALGCGGAVPGGGGGTIRANPPSDAGVDAPGLELEAPPPPGITARGLGEDEASAYAAATQALAGELLGDPRWLELLELELHSRERDPISLERGAGGVRLELRLERERAAALLASLPQAPLRLQAPGAWMEVLEAFVRAHLRRLSCERGRLLFEQECEPPDTAVFDEALAGLGSRLSIVSLHEGGVPLDVEGRALRAPGARLLQGSAPVPSAPLRVESAAPGQQEGERVQTDARGQARFASAIGGAVWDGPIEVRLDAEALLGPLGEYLRVEPLSLRGRPTNLGRWGAIVSESAQGRPTTDDVFARALLAAFSGRGLGAPVSLPSADAHGLRGAPEGTVQARLPALADGEGGRLDVLLVVDVESVFASRGGASRIWFEASGQLTAYDAWTGEVLLRTQVASTRDGIGELRADRAARRALAVELLERLIDSGRVRLP
ncbi:MAG: hypothetical protein OEY14_15715 [Myxococcales bacterium]|nr:hypothetical protein [Myxococcales bacterium]